MDKKHKKPPSPVWIALLLCLCLASLSLSSTQVDVELIQQKWRTLPFIVLKSDDRGNQNLTKNDLEFLLNGYSTRDFQLFDQHRKATHKKDSYNFLEENLLDKQRLIILFLDSLFMDSNHLTSSKQIARTIIDAKKKSDRILIVTTGMGDSGFLASVWDNASRAQKYLSEIKYNHEIKRLSPEQRREIIINSLNNLKFFLKNYPSTNKLFFFSSGTCPERDQTSYSLTNIFYGRISKLIIQSSALSFIINPSRKVINQNLRELATRCNGLFISGPSPEIIRNLRQYQAGYYELVFLEDPKIDQNSLIVKSNNSSLKIFHILQRSRIIPFKEFTPGAKKKLALNLASGNGLFSAGFKILPVEIDHDLKGKSSRVMQVTLPADLVKKKVNLYKIGQSEDQFTFSDEEIPSAPYALKLNFKFLQDLKNYFVLVDYQQRLALVGGDSLPSVYRQDNYITKLYQVLGDLESDLSTKKNTGMPNMIKKTQQTVPEPDQEINSENQNLPGGTLNNIIREADSIKHDFKSTACMEYMNNALFCLNNNRLEMALKFLYHTRDTEKANEKTLRVVRKLITQLEQIIAFNNRHKTLKKTIMTSLKEFRKKQPGLPDRQELGAKSLGNLASVLPDLEDHFLKTDSLLSTLTQSLAPHFSQTVAPLKFSIFKNPGSNCFQIAAKKLADLKESLPSKGLPGILDAPEISRIFSELQGLIAKSAGFLQGLEEKLTVEAASRFKKSAKLVFNHHRLFSYNLRKKIYTAKLRADKFPEKWIKEDSFIKVAVFCTDFSINDKGYIEGQLADGMTFIYIPSGPFLMGIKRKAGGPQDESPQHEVSLDAYWMAKYETTNSQFTSYLDHLGQKAQDVFNAGKEGVRFSPRRSYRMEGGTYSRMGYRGFGSTYNFDSKHRPAINLTWEQARDFCRWKSREYGLYFRLPTEAEWEKAAKGTRHVSYPWGNNKPDGKKANFADHKFLTVYGRLNPEIVEQGDSSQLSWIDRKSDDGYAMTAPVGKYKAGASPYGVMDMAGNVWEYVLDWYDSDYYVKSPSSNPMGPITGLYKTSRGGAWDSHVWYLRTTTRAAVPLSRMGFTQGFRVVLMYQ